MCHSEPSLTSAGAKSESRDVEDIEGLGVGAPKGLDIVAFFQKRTPRQASISSGVRIAPPLASHGAWAPHQMQQTQFRLK